MWSVDPVVSPQSAPTLWSLISPRSVAMQSEYPATWLQVWTLQRLPPALRCVGWSSPVGTPAVGGVLTAALQGSTPPVQSPAGGLWSVDTSVTVSVEPSVLHVPR